MIGIGVKRFYGDRELDISRPVDTSLGPISLLREINGPARKQRNDMRTDRIEGFESRMIKKFGEDLDFKFKSPDRLLPDAMKVGKCDRRMYRERIWECVYDENDVKNADMGFLTKEHDRKVLGNLVLRGPYYTKCDWLVKHMNSEKCVNLFFDTLIELSRIRFLGRISKLGETLLSNTIREYSMKERVVMTTIRRMIAKDKSAKKMLSYNDQMEYMRMRNRKIPIDFTSVSNACFEVYGKAYEEKRAEAMMKSKLQRMKLETEIARRKGM